MITYRFRISPKQREILDKLKVDNVVSPFTHGEKPSEVHRRLYGVIGVERISYHGESACRFYIPGENQEAVEEARRGGWFSKSVREEDLEVLQAVSDRDKELKQRKRRYPGFTEIDVCRLSERGRRPTREALDRLTGLLGFLDYTYVGPKDREDKDDMGTTTTYWFVPVARREIIDAVLSGQIENANQLWLPGLKPRKPYQVEAVPV